MKRTAEILEQLRTYTERQIPLLWLAVLGVLIAAHLVAGLLIEHLWSEHFPVSPWVGIAGVLLALAFILGERIYTRLRKYEAAFQRTAMGYWDHERGYYHCDRIRWAAGGGFLGAVVLYAGFLLAQVRAACADPARKVLVDLDVRSQLELLSQPEHGAFFVAGLVLVGAAWWRIMSVRAELRQELRL